jgi:two-component system chemotaxis sensor kinase CheA
MTVDIGQFHQVFFEEAVEHLAVLEQLLIAIDIDKPDSEQLNAIFRAAHSIKGGSGIFGFSEMAEFTHELESLLDQWRSGRTAVQKHAVDVCLETRDHLANLLDYYRRGAPIDAQVLNGLVEVRTKLRQLCVPIDANAASDDSFGLFSENVPAAAMQTLTTEDDSFGFFDDVHVGEPMPQDLLDSQVQASSGTTPALGAGAAKPQASIESSSIRVSIEKTDQLINLVGELVITQAMLDQMGSEFDVARNEGLHRALGQLSRNTRQLQEAAMSLRMLPINQIFSRFPRLVRDLAGKLQKDVELVMEGEHTELDKGLIEKLADPLTHLVRNSIDHGLETIADRIAAGKPARGTLRLKAFHQGGNIVVEVSDDGRGLQREKILAKARERGLPVGADMSDAEVWQLIFEPGFSTADAITDVSGRGVGMDVVRRNIATMSGRVEIDSWAGQGSRVRIRLPLTLAILDGMLVNSGGETYVIPLASIVESMQPEANSISTIAGGGRVVSVHGEYLPLAALHELFGLKSRCESASEAIIVLLEAASGTFALEVDGLAGQSQVVIKSLESNYRRVDGFSGATILGSGRVAMIIDVDSVLRMSQQARVA